MPEAGPARVEARVRDNLMTKYQLEDKKSQESLVDGRGMWHRLFCGQEISK